MKSLILSNLACSQLSAHCLGFPERDELFVQLHSLFLFFSQKSILKNQQIPLKIDQLKMIFEVETDGATILVVQICFLDEEC